uniref:Uncharacterized protein n=1 Tax=Opuntia streptacantha TaxID=393608 RepID=A0A7C8ZLP0_OPUST
MTEPSWFYNGKRLLKDPAICSHIFTGSHKGRTHDSILITYKSSWQVFMDHQEVKESLLLFFSCILATTASVASIFLEEVSCKKFTLKSHHYGKGSHIQKTEFPVSSHKMFQH